jgi:hypothetical protein
MPVAARAAQSGKEVVQSGRFESILWAWVEFQLGDPCFIIGFEASLGRFEGSATKNGA